jgi:hypothetical protein
MELTEEHINFIREDLQKRGITIDTLLHGLVDHICCIIESDNSLNFMDAYNLAINAFGKDELSSIQEETILQLNTQVNMKKTIYVLSYLVALLTSTGLLFILLHLKGGSILLVSAVAVFNFCLLPLYLIGRYKRQLG